jgi:hypothetical protein
MTTKKAAITIIISLFLMLPMRTILGVAEDRRPPSLFVEYQKGVLILKAREIPLNLIFDAIRNECLIEISGLERRESEPVTLSLQSVTLEEGLKQILNHLGEKNYAFEFVDEKLRRVSVLPRAKKGISALPLPTNEVAVEQGFADRPVIYSIVKGSQADTLNLLEGDIVVEYDDVKIKTARQLIKVVKSKSDKGQVDMIVVRDSEPIRFVLNGGFIGIRVLTVRIPKEELKRYYSGHY